MQDNDWDKVEIPIDFCIYCHCALYDGDDYYIDGSTAICEDCINRYIIENEGWE